MSESINSFFYYVIMLSGYIITFISLYFTYGSYIKAKKESDFLRGNFRSLFEQARGLKNAVVSLNEKSNNIDKEALKLGIKLLLDHAEALVNSTWSFCESLALTEKERKKLEKEIRRKRINRENNQER